MSDSGLTYYIHDGAAAFRLQLSGALSHSSTVELDQARRTASSVFGGRSLVVDVTGVESIDAAGCELLEKWHGLGAQIVVSTRQAKARIQTMTQVPCRCLASDQESRGWLARGGAIWLWAFKGQVR